MNQKQINKELIILQRKEAKFVNQNLHIKTSAFQNTVEKYVPEKLSGTLDVAFFKAFQLIFEKGTGVIEKTYDREKKEQDYRVNEYAAEVKKSRKTLKAFGRHAAASKNVNMAISAAEGLGMGVLGLGIPDIPIFLGVLLKSIYEIALTYGFHYDTEEEHMFILKIIETALSHEQNLIDADRQLNNWKNEKNIYEISKEEQMRKTADALSQELLYLKFVQGIPIVGVVGGLSDMVYQKKIVNYAELKYKRRFLESKMQEN